MYKLENHIAAFLRGTCRMKHGDGDERTTTHPTGSVSDKMFDQEQHVQCIEWSHKEKRIMA